MNSPQTPCYMSNLLNHKIITAEGKHIGHVADVVLTPEASHKVTGLLYGESGWEHRLHLLNPFSKVEHSPTEPNVIPWENVERVERSTIILKPDAHV